MTEFASLSGEELLQSLIEKQRAHIIMAWKSDKEVLERFEASVAKLDATRRVAKEPGVDDIVEIRIVQPGTQYLSDGVFETVREEQPGFKIRKDLTTWDRKTHIGRLFTSLVVRYYDGGTSVWFDSSDGYAYGEPSWKEGMQLIAHAINTRIVEATNEL